MVDHLDVLWADAELGSLKLGYDDLELQLVETTGRRVAVRGEGQIGVRVCGFWDEVVVESGVVIDDHPFALECLQSIAARPGVGSAESGSPVRNDGTFSTLVVTLIDGLQILCVAGGFVVERSS